MTLSTVRGRVILWLYAVAAAHFIGGLLLAWTSDLALLEGYYRLIEQAFWHGGESIGTRDFQRWWLSLFGASIQTLGIWMAALIYLGQRYRSRFAWGALLLGFALWAPQDIAISLQASAWVHVWVDLLAVLSATPPLLWLWRCDADALEVEPVGSQRERLHFSPLTHRVLVTGGTGFIGQLLVRQLLADGQDVIVLTRQPQEAARLFKGRVKCISHMAELPSSYPLEVIMNLAGARVLGWRWSSGRKQILWNSRVALTQSIVAWIAGAEYKPRLLITASAIGYYGIQQQGDATPLTEQSPPQPLFMSQLCQDWERAANQASGYGVAVVCLRLGVVLGQRGALPMMLFPIKCGLGGSIGSGKQWLSWVHVEDVLRALAHVWQLHASAGHSGTPAAYNLTAPGVVSQYQFNQIAARVLHRPCIISTPGWLLRLVLGEQAGLLLEGQCVVPKKLLEAGFQFKYPSLESALESLK